MSSFTDFIATMERRRRAASDALEDGRSVRRAGAVLLASRYGLYNAALLADAVKANGRPDYRRISEAPPSRWHVCEIPAYTDISAAVADLTRDSNRALSLRALGVIIEDKSVKRISRHIRGLMRALWLYHLWAGHSVGALRAKHYHPSGVKPDWAEAGRMHGDGERLADASAWLHALCAEYHKRTDKPHAGAAFLVASQALITRATMETA